MALASFWFGRQVALDALVSAGPVPPPSHQVADQDKQYSAGQGTPNNNRDYVTEI